MDLRIAVVGVNLFPEGLSTYPNRYIHDLHVGLNVEIHYITNGHKNKVFKYNGIYIHMVNSSFCFEFEDFKRKLISLNPDIIVLFGTFFNLLRLYKLKKIPAKKVFFPCFSKYSIFHVFDQYNKFSYYIHHLVPLKSKLLSRYTDLIVCPTNNIRDIIMKELGGNYNEKVVMIRPGIKIERVNTSKDNYFSYFGDADKDRGIERIIYAAEKFPETNFKFYIRNFKIEDKHKRNYRIIYKLTSNLNNIEVIVKNLSSEGIKRAMAQSLAVLLPFREYYPTEVPYTVLEALSVGTVVLTTPVNGIPEVVVDGVNGILCSQKRDGLVDAIKKFHRLYVERGIIRNLSDEYDLERNRKKLREKYKEILT